MLPSPLFLSLKNRSKTVNIFQAITLLMAES
jgi:hypothetical protein